MIEIKAVPGKLIMLGRQGENLAREVIFSVSGVRAEFGDGAFRLSARRAGESNVYPAAVTENGDTVEWSLTSADTQNAGRGSCELAYYAGDVRLKTWVYDTAVAKSLTGSPETDPYDEFLDEVNRLAAEAAISQREAKNSENAAKTSEENAKASENAAKTSENNAAEYARAALAAETKSKQNAEYAASAATTAGQYAQNAATSATNAASSASAAETHEKGAKDAATAAAKSAEGLADAVKRAEDAATAAQDNAGKTAADREAVAEMKTAAETAAATATEKAAEIADSAAQIATNTDNIGKNATNIETNATGIDLLRRENVELRAKTDALWKLSEGKSYDFVEDANGAYSKNVPAGCRFAQIEKIGGKTVARDTGELVSAVVEDVEVQGANLIPYPANSMNFPITRNGITVTANDDGTYLVNGTATNDIYVSVCNLNAAGMRISNIGDVVLSGCPTGGSTATYYLSMYFGQWRADTGAGATATIGTIPDTARIEITIRKGCTANNLIFSPQLRRGTTITGYSPYFLDTYPIPVAVKALPGYGWSAGNLYNEIVRRADGWDYVQRVGLPATTDGYTVLNTPMTTDITDLMTGALPLVATEPGGTITMRHTLADDGLTIDVPNTVKFIRDLKEVVSSGTE